MAQQKLRVSRSVTPGVIVEVRIHVAPSFQKCLHHLRPTQKLRIRVRGREHLSWTVKAEIDEVRCSLDFRHRISAGVRNDECRAMFAPNRLHLLSEAGPIPKFQRKTSRARASCVSQEFIDRLRDSLRMPESSK